MYWVWEGTFQCHSLSDTSVWWNLLISQFRSTQVQFCSVQNVLATVHGEHFTFLVICKHIGRILMCFSLNVHLGQGSSAQLLSPLSPLHWAGWAVFENRNWHSPLGNLTHKTNNPSVVYISASWLVQCMFNLGGLLQGCGKGSLVL